MKRIAIALLIVSVSLVMLGCVTMKEAPLQAHKPVKKTVIYKRVGVDL